jgi:recombinational DNA repair protein RecT
MTGIGHIEGVAESDTPIGYGAYLKLVKGYEATVYMTKDEVLAHAKRYSPTFDKKENKFKAKSRWLTDFDEQALKTVMKKLIMNKGRISEKDRTMLEQIDTEKADATPQWNEDVFNENESDEPTDGEIVEEKPELDHDLEIACQGKDSKNRLYTSLPTGELRFHLKGIRAKGDKATEQDTIHAQAIEMIIAARESGVLEEPGAKQPGLV